MAVATGLFPKYYQSKLSPDIAKCHLGAKITPHGESMVYNLGRTPAPDLNPQGCCHEVLYPGADRHLEWPGRLLSLNTELDLMCLVA